ncbi:zinc ribbon domain-containing protein [Achromobacter sp.]|uniref:zinc ribbon domain-containing protein n=1 Tax=Achromobacter sp. TaxID=134375 RepID=UPI003CFC6DA3
MSFNVMECAQCGHRVYPARLWCPACGHDGAHEVALEEAELLAWTQVPGKAGESGSVFATVNALPRGPLLVVRLPEAPRQGAGQRLRLLAHTWQGVTLPWAQAPSDGEGVPGKH